MNKSLKPLSEKFRTPARVRTHEIDALNATSRMYLAIARKELSERLIYVYTLGLPAGRNDTFYMTANPDVAVFNSAAKADAYTKKIQDIMEKQSQWPLFTIARRTLHQELEEFHKNVK